MTGILDTISAECVCSSVDATGKCLHKCADDHELTIGELEAKLLKRFEPEQMEGLHKLGVRVIYLTIEDVELAGNLIDEVHAHLGANHADHGYLYKHSMACRMEYDLISIIDSIYAKRNKVCSEIFGNKISWYNK